MDNIQLFHKTLCRWVQEKESSIIYLFIYLIFRWLTLNAMEIKTKNKKVPYKLWKALWQASAGSYTKSKGPHLISL